MRTNAKSRRAGFTLIELLTVVAIIVVLAALTIVALRFFKRRQAEDKTRVQVRLIESALEEYKLDIGFYPPSRTVAASSTREEDFTTNEDGREATHTLYMELYGYGAENKGRIYLAELDPTSLKQGWINSTGGAASITIVDAFNNEFRYRKLEDKSRQKNPEFDLWSVGFDGKTSATGGDYDPTAKENKDDIW